MTVAISSLFMASYSIFQICKIFAMAVVELTHNSL
jgi:hypothetical protein